MEISVNADECEGVEEGMMMLLEVGTNRIVNQRKWKQDY